MATFEITEGPPGQGKSLYAARLAGKLAARNRRWFERQTKAYNAALASRRFALEILPDDKREAWIAANPEPKAPAKRVIYSNIKFAPHFEDAFEGFIAYWTDLDQLCKLRDVDILWDEIATELDARNWPNLSVEAKRFLSQYRKRGIDIYANTQDFSMIDVRARLMITRVQTLTKLVGSPDISTTKPPPKHVWGLIIIREVQNWKEVDPDKKRYALIPGIMLIERELVDRYDTRQDIEVGKPPPLRHEVRTCEKHGSGCDFVRVTHA